MLHTKILMLALVALTAASASAIPTESGHFKLKSSIDRPQDGYCLDIVGSGPHIRFDMPLTAHNCKPGLYQDEEVQVDSKLRLRFPAYNVCATVAGINGKALPGAAVLPRICGEQTPFLDARPLQSFKFHNDGRVELKDSGLCLTVSEQSLATFEPTHRWRALYMASCQDAKTIPERTQWEFVPKGYVPAK